MRTITLSAALVALTLAPAANAAGYHFTTIDHPDTTTLTYALGVNNHGDVSGTYLAADGTFHGYTRVHGVIQPLEFPGSTQTVCGGIEDDGRVTGTYVDTQGFQHGFQYVASEADEHGEGDDDHGSVSRAGHFKSIDAPGAAQTTGIPFELGPGLGTSAIRTENDVIVGQYADKTGFSHGFALHDGALSTIDFPGAAHVPGHGTEVFAVNHQGVLGGSYVQYTSPPVHGFVYAGGQYTTFDVPGAGGPFGTQINGMNDQGTLVGPFSDANGAYHGFVSRSGQLTVVDVPGAVFTEVDSINDHDVIVGEWISPDGVTHGYIGTR